MKHIYRASWSWYDANIDMILLSERDFSQKGFETYITQMVRRSAEELLTQNPPEDFIGGDTLLKKATELMEKDGFERVSYRATFDMYGSFIIDNDERDRDSYLDILGDDVFAKVTQYNKKLRGEAEK